MDRLRHHRQPVTSLRDKNSATPGISCLCITRCRYHLLPRSIHCYDFQTHLHRELVIVAEESDEPTLKYLDSLKNRSDVQIIVIKDDQRKSLGELRNIAISHARYEYIAQWDDDDFYSPERLAVQIAEINRTHKSACLLYRLIVIKGSQSMVTQYREWEGSIVCRKADMPAYPNLARAEDTAVTQELLGADRVTLLDRPDLYVYLYHGANTWYEENHWQVILGNSTAVATPEKFPVLNMLNEYEQRRMQSSGTA